jgi:molybdopterin synthase catalytic subunit
MELTKEKKKKSTFKDGAISPEFIASSISKHQHKKEIGAHRIFLGQVREDHIDGSVVAAIEFTCYDEMADKEVEKLREEAFEKFQLTCLHIYHSKGVVNSGEICFFVFASSSHRKDSDGAVEFIVEEFKKRVPVFGKEVLDNGDGQWKVNVK